MDSLLASYASSSSDEEEEEQQQQPQEQPIPSVPPKTTSSSLFSSLPQPKSSSSLFESLPQPKQPSINPSLPTATATDDVDTGTSSNFSQSASLLFSSLPRPKPKPKSQIHQQPKKIVQFKPPIIPFPNPTQLHDDEDDIDDEEEEEERNRRRKLESSTQTPSVKSFLSSIPAPRNTATLGVQSSSGSGRRSILETEAPALEPVPASNSGGSAMESNVPVDQNGGDYENYENYTGYQYGTDHYAGYGDYSSGFDQSVGVQPEAGGVAGTATSSYGNDDDAYASYGAYGDYGRYGDNWVDGSAATVPEASGVSDNAARFPGKRGRNEIPAEIIEVKQEELIKNRPREDQVKLTGIAFGPSYQPVSAKGKPSKLHKRKHQIGSLYFDMKQNEMKLAERRAKGMLTKAETQAKYGW